MKKKVTKKSKKLKKSTRKRIWDYSKVPRKEWEWQHGQYNYYSVVTTPNGLKYSVDDFWDSHGAGFQTYKIFFSEGPKSYMPEDIRNEISQFILPYRQGGGVLLIIQIENLTPKNPFWQLQFTLDSIWVTTIMEFQANKKNPLKVYEVEIAPREHILSWAIVVDYIKNEPKYRWIVYGKCKFKVSSGDSRIELQLDSSKQGKVEITAFCNHKKLDIFDIDQFQY
ncbi:MAG: hypothetical protein ACFFCM_02480 [Promethearchaeota archaeon]